MGMMKKPSGCRNRSDAPPLPPEPDPARFTIQGYEQVGANLVVCVVYPGCTSYEGRKVLVFERLSIQQLRKCPTLDPHFADVVAVGTACPVARFEPTTRGWKLARLTAASL